MSTRVQGVLSTLQIICSVVDAHDFMFEDTMVDKSHHVSFVCHNQCFISPEFVRVQATKKVFLEMRYKALE
jgi:hypothetical protein